MHGQFKKKKGKIPVGLYQGHFKVIFFIKSFPSLVMHSPFAFTTFKGLNKPLKIVDVSK